MMNPIIKVEEGFRSTAYLCTEGYPTIGYGTRLCNIKDVPLEYYNDLVFTETIAEIFMGDKLSTIETYILNEFGYNILDCRMLVLQSMCYQLGISGFKKFRKMIDAIHNEDWDKVSEEALDSRWARQTPERANRHAKVLKDGDLKAYRGLIRNI